MDTNNDPLLGLTSADCDGVVIGFDADLDDIEELVSLTLGKKPWTRRTRSRCEPAKSPMRLVQFKGSSWTVLYFVDGLRTEAMPLLDYAVLGDLSLAVEGTMMVLSLGDTSGYYSLSELFIGLPKTCMATNCRQLRGTPLEALCEKADVAGIDARLREVGFRYGQLEDGGRHVDGAILPFSEVEPLCDLVAQHRLLV